MRVGIDADGCFYDFVRSWEEYNHLEVKPPSSWDFYLDDHGYSLEDYLRTFEQGVNDGYIFRIGEPKPGSIEAMTKLKEAGHTLHIVTDRFVGWRSQINTTAWLNEWKVPFHSLTFAKDKTLVNVDYFIDDRPKNVDALRKFGVEAWLLDEGRSDQVGHPYWIPDWEAFLGKVM